jgi:hypothetical protein
MAGSNPGFKQGQIPTSAEWNSAFTTKADYTQLTSESTRAQGAEGTLAIGVAGANDAANEAVGTANLAIPKTHINAANGVAGLEETGLLASQLFGTTTGTVADGGALATTTETAASAQVTANNAQPKIPASENQLLTGPAALGGAPGTLTLAESLLSTDGALAVAYGTSENTALQGSLLGAVSGVAPLGSDSLVPIANLPPATAIAGSQPQFTVLAGPASGAGAVTWRRLAFADISGLGSAAQLVAGGANGAAVLDTLGNASPLNVLATSSTIARSLAARAADTVNVKDHGAILNGTTNDLASFQAAYNATPNGGTILIPGGGLHNTGTFAATPGKNVLWQTTGALNFNTGTIPVTTAPGDGDVLAGFWSGRYNYTKTIVNSTDGGSVLLASLNNNSGSQFSTGVISNLELSTTSNPGCSGFTWGLNSTLNSGSTGGVNSQDVGMASSVVLTGQSQTWQFFGQTKDWTGLPGGARGVVAGEYDITCSGPEPASSVFSPGTGSRVFHHFVTRAYLPPNWPGATQAVAVGTVIQGSASGVASTFICTTAGTTGATAPVWPSSGTVTDGTVAWTFGTTVVTQISRAIDIGANTNTSYGAGVVMNGPFYSAGIDLSAIIPAAANVAGLRLSANQPIDFSGNQTLAGMNIRTLQYNSTATAWQYVTNGLTALSIADTGIATFGFAAKGITAAQNDNSTNFATTAWYTGQAGTANPIVNGTAAIGSSLLFARQDHVHPTDTSRAPIASPAFTGLVGVPRIVAIPAAAQVGFTVSGTTGAVGFDTSGAALSGSAFRMASGQKLALEGTSTFAIGLDGSNNINFYNGLVASLSISHQGDITAAGAINGVSLSIPGAVSGAGFSAYMASPPAIGGTLANAASFTTLSSTGAAALASVTGRVSGSAPAGAIGEVISQAIPSGSAVSLTTGAPAAIVSITLTPGDWDVWGLIATSPGATTTTSVILASINSTSALIGTPPNSNVLAFKSTLGGGLNFVNGLPPLVVTVSASTTYFLNAEVSFAVSTMAAYGAIYARRRS